MAYVWHFEVLAPYWPVFVNGALNRDYTLVMGVVIVYAALVIVMTLISDLLYAVLDPRVRLDR